LVLAAQRLPVQQHLQIGRQSQRLLSQRNNVRLGKDFQAGQQSHHAHYGRVRKLEASSAWLRNKAIRETESSVTTHSPPASIARQLVEVLVLVFLVHKNASNVSRTRVDVLVRAPTCKVDTPIV